MTAPLGRLFNCLICGQGHETWGVTMEHLMGVHQLPLALARLLSTIRLVDEVKR